LVHGDALKVSRPQNRAISDVGSIADPSIQMLKTQQKVSPGGKKGADVVNLKEIPGKKDGGQPLGVDSRQDSVHSGQKSQKSGGPGGLI